MAPKIKLTYLDTKGRAEAIRLAFVVGGVEFEDERISSSEFTERKTSGTLTFGSLPVMEVDGEMFGESGAQLRYAANLSGLTPTCPVNACKVDMVIDCIETIIYAAVKDSTPEGRAKFVENDLPRYLGPVETLVGKAEGPFLLGENISAADIKTSVMLDVLKNGSLDHVPTDCADKYTALNEMYTAVMEHEKIKEYYASK